MPIQLKTLCAVQPTAATRPIRPPSRESVNRTSLIIVAVFLRGVEVRVPVSKADRDDGIQGSESRTTATSVASAGAATITAAGKP